MARRVNNPNAQKANLLFWTEMNQLPSHRGFPPSAAANTFRGKLQTRLKHAKSKNYVLYGVLLLILVNVVRIQELFTFLIPFRLGIIANLLALLLMIFGKKTPQKFNLMKIPQVKLTLAIYGLCLFSVPFSVYRGQSFDFVVVSLPKTLFFYLLMHYAVNTYTDLQKVFYTYFVGTFLMALFTILSKGTGRLTATATYDPNDMAAVCVVSLPLIYFHINHLKGKIRLLLLIILLALVAALTLTVSRGGFLGFLTVIALILLKDKYRSWKVKTAVIGILVFAFSMFATESYWDRIGTITSQEDYNVTEEYGRQALWKRGLQLMLENPITGVGAGAIVTGVGQSYGPDGGRWMTVHNSFLQVGGELGIGGLLIFISLLYTSIRWLHQLGSANRQTKNHPQEYAWIATALEISLIAYCVLGFFLSWAYHPVFFFLIALTGIINKIKHIEKRSKIENAIRQYMQIAEAK
jgi:O-antigen ligase